MAMTDDAADLGFFSPRQVENLTSLSGVSIWRLRRAGSFPAPMRLGCARVGYPKSEVLAWLASHMTPAGKAKGGEG